MTIHDPAPKPVPLIPESAPFSLEQRSWLNGFFAGLLSLDHQPGISAVAGVPDVAAKALGGDDADAPWHDPAMAIGARMTLANGKPQRRQMFAAMAQQDCGQCGYLCEIYANKLASGEEKRANLCVPGGKDTSRMLKKLLEAAPEAANTAIPADQAATPAAKASGKPAGQLGYSREQPVTALFKSALRLNGDGSEKDTRHIVFDIMQSGIEYQPGDSFGLAAPNDPGLVEAVLASMKAPADFPVGNGKTFREVLLNDYALGQVPDILFEFASYMVGGSRRQKLKALAKGQDPDGDAETYDVLKVLETFGPMHPDPEGFLECLEPLQPRLYSISSSPVATPGELHLTVDAVRYAIGQRQRVGVASTYLCDRATPGDSVSVYIQKAHGFALPANPSTPVIMVGPGTGIAPFRSFLWHRHAQKAPGKAWLFFGHQREATDFYYRDELDTLSRSGALTRLSTAWSRDGDTKVYVQDRMREAGPELWAWLKSGAHFYVCGDAKRMAKDVETAIADIAEAHGHMSAAGAKDFISELKAAGRYQADVY